MGKKQYIREVKTISTERYMEVDLFGITDRQHKARRGPRSAPTSGSQEKANRRRAARKRLQTMNANFCVENSYHVSLTYSNEMLPKTTEEAAANRANYIRRIARECKRRELPPPLVMGVDAGGAGHGRYHHHMVIVCELPRELLEDLWRKGTEPPNEAPPMKKRREKLWAPYRPCKGERIGRANADVAQPEHESLAQLCRYFEQQPNRRWFNSRGLKQPKIRKPADRKFTPRRLDEVCRDGRVYDRAFWRKHYPDFELAEDVDVRYDEINGWIVTLRLYRPWPDIRRKKDGP